MGGKSADEEQIKLNAINAFKSTTEKLGLMLNDESTDRTVILKAEGNYKSGYIKLAVEFSFRQKFSRRGLGIDKSNILIETYKEIPPYKIEVLKGAVRSENLSEPQKSEIMNFIQEKHLDYFDFDVNAIGNKVVITVHNQIEEGKLWLDYIELAEILVKE